MVFLHDADEVFPLGALLDVIELFDMSRDDIDIDLDAVRLVAPVAQRQIIEASVAI